MQNNENIEAILLRIADSLEKLAGSSPEKMDFSNAEAFVWQESSNSFSAVREINRMPLELLHTDEKMREKLLENTEAFASGYPANNALLWGARGMGKSSLVKAIHGFVAEKQKEAEKTLKLLEISRDDISSLPECLSLIRAEPYRFIIFCDDLSFDKDDTSYKSLKAVLEGGIEGRPENVIFYATSNRRHLMPRDMIENERSTAINPAESIEEKVSLSDRFGLWIGFHNCSQNDYLSIVHNYAKHFGLNTSDNFEAQALEWCITRGSRSGRVAWQFIQDLAGKQRKKLKY